MHALTRDVGQSIGLGRFAILACCVASASVGALAMVLTGARLTPLSGGANQPVPAKRKILADESQSTAPKAFSRDHVRYSSTVLGAGPISSDIQVGDRLTIGGADGLKRVLRIVSIKQHNLYAGPKGNRRPIPFLVVTAVDVDRPNAKPIRFIVEDQRAVPPAQVPVPSADGPRVL